MNTPVIYNKHGTYHVLQSGNQTLAVIDCDKDVRSGVWYAIKAEPNIKPPHYFTLVGERHYFDAPHSRNQAMDVQNVCNILGIAYSD